MRKKDFYIVQLGLLKDRFDVIVFVPLSLSRIQVSVVNTKLFSGVMVDGRACAVGIGKEYCLNVNSLLILDRSVE